MATRRRMTRMTDQFRITSSFLSLVATPFATSSFLLLVVMPGATSSFLLSSDALCS